MQFCFNSVVRLIEMLNRLQDIYLLRFEHSSYTVRKMHDGNIIAQLNKIRKKS
jgi:hypothetical protein